MPRTILPDTSIFDQIYRGNQNIANTLIKLSKTENVMIPQQTYKELMQGDPAWVEANKVLLEDLQKTYNIKLAPPGDSGKRADFYQQNSILAEKGKGQHIQDGLGWKIVDGKKVMSTPKGVDNLRDAGLAAQVYSLDGEILSVDGGFLHPTKSKALNLKIAEESRQFSKALGKTDVNRGRAAEPSTSSHHSGPRHEDREGTAPEPDDTECIRRKQRNRHSGGLDCGRKTH